MEDFTVANTVGLTKEWNVLGLKGSKEKESLCFADFLGVTEKGYEE